MGYDESLIDEIRDRADIVAIISDYVKLRRAGRNYLGLCPFHPEKTPSFTVSPDKQMYYCFGCQAGGNVFNFLMAREGLTFTEALRWVARRVGVTLPEDRDPKAQQRRSERRAVLAALEAAAAHYQRMLVSDSAGGAAMKYAEGRGLDRETIDRFRLGYATPGWGDLFAALSSKRMPAAVLERAGLVKARRGGGGYYDWLRHRLIFPIRDQRGRVLGFGGRALGEDGPKYLNSPESPVFNKRHMWYALDLARENIRRQGRAVVVEGYMDAIALHRAGIDNAVASLGTALTQEQAMAISRLASEVVIAYDADAAGTAATLRGLEVLRRVGTTVRVARLPEGSDPDDFVRRRGAEAFERVLREALPLFEYRLWLARREHDPATVEGQVAVAREMLPVVAVIDDAVEQSARLRQLAAAAGVPEEALRRELRRHLRRRGQRTDNSGYGRQANEDRNSLESLGAGDAAGGAAHAERLALGLILGDDDLARQVLAGLSANEFTVPAHRRIVEALDRSLAGGPGGGRTLDHLEDEGAARLVSQLLLEPPPVEDGDAARMLRDALWRMRQGRLRARVDGLLAEIERRERQQEAVPAELLTELGELQRRIKQGPELPVTDLAPAGRGEDKLGPAQ